MNLSLVQYTPEWENKNRNKEKIISLLELKNISCDLLIFPEMTLTGFSMDTENLSDKREGENLRYFSDVARKFSTNVIALMIERDVNYYFNTLFHISPSGSLINFYRKIHPFSYSSENKFFTGGEKPVITEIEDWKIGLSICYDLRFPELFRFYAKERVDMIVNIANWPIPRIEHWRTLLKARAIENQCFVVGVNRIGNDPNANYNGYSSVFNPMGNEIITLPDKEDVISTTLKKEDVEEVRSKLPFLKDIRLI